MQFMQFLYQVDTIWYIFWNFKLIMLVCTSIFSIIIDYTNQINIIGR